MCWIVSNYVGFVKDLLKGEVFMYTSIEKSKDFAELTNFLRDFQLIEHSVNVMKLACHFAEYLQLSEKEKQSLRVGAYVHDIGKTKIDTNILNKPGKLTEAEFEEVKKHPLEGLFIIRKFNFINKDMWDIAIQHHERPDGKGYPFGLRDEEINPLAKIVQICDVYDALVSKRCYKKELKKEDAILMIKDSLGTQFNKRLGTDFITFMKEYDLSQVNKFLS